MQFFVQAETTKIRRHHRMNLKLLGVSDVSRVIVSPRWSVVLTNLSLPVAPFRVFDLRKAGITVFVCLLQMRPFLTPFEGIRIMAYPHIADVAELADAQVSEACDGDIVEVQVLSSAPSFKKSGEPVNGSRPFRV